MMSASDVEQEVKFDDKDLVQLSGYYAYKAQKRGAELEVNGKIFRVEHVEESPSGMEAFTVRNITVLDDDGEIDRFKQNEEGGLAIVFVGSRDVEDFTGTNLFLPGYAEPQQTLDALQYSEDLQNGNIKTEIDGVKQSLTGELEAVAGNSLGGSHAGRVGIAYPAINAVTLNPAPQPGSSIDPDAEYANVTNYYDEYDVLVNILKLGGMEHRIPGELIEIHSGLPIPDPEQLMMDHMGYPQQKIDDEFKIEVGEPGKPGHGYIYTGADEFIITDIWTNEPLYGETELIDINVGTLLTLASRMKERIIGQLDIAGDYLNNANEKGEHESARFHERKALLQEDFRDLLNQYGDEKVLDGIATTGTAMKDMIASMRKMLDVAEGKCRSANVVLNSIPMEVMEFLLSIDISVESLFSYPQELLGLIEDGIDDVIGGAKKVINDALPTVLSNAANTKKDAVVEEMLAHYKIMLSNKEVINNQLKTYEEQVGEVAINFALRDSEISNAIENGGYIQNTISRNLPLIPEFKVKPSNYLQTPIWKEQVELAQEKASRFLLKQLVPNLECLKELLDTFKSALALGEESLDSVRNNIVFDFVKDYSDAIHEFVSLIGEAQRELRDIILLIDGWVQAIVNLIQNIPSLVERIKPYIQTAVLDKVELGDIHLYTLSTELVVMELEVMFEEIVRQLSQQKANSIAGLAANSKMVLDNISTFKEQVNCAIDALQAF